MNKGKVIIVGLASAIVVFLALMGFSLFKMVTEPKVAPIELSHEETIVNSTPVQEEVQVESQPESLTEEESEISQEEQAEAEVQAKEYQDALNKVQKAQAEIEIAKTTPPARLTEEQKELLKTIPKEELPETTRIEIYGDPNMPNGPNVTQEQMDRYNAEWEKRRQEVPQMYETIEVQGVVSNTDNGIITFSDGTTTWRCQMPDPSLWRVNDTIKVKGHMENDILVAEEPVLMNRPFVPEQVPADQQPQPEQQPA